MQPEPIVADHDHPDDPGRLANNGMFVKMLQTALSRSDTNLNTIPGLILDIINLGRWRAWLTPDGEEIRWSAADFRRFIEAPRPHGCQTPITLVRKILAGTDTLPRFEELIRGEVGAAPGEVRNPYGVKGKPEQEINCDNITHNLSPETIPFPVRNTPPPTGTSTSYAIRRLRDHAPELLERVRAGELTANAAMVKAGFRKPLLQAPDDPERLAAYLLRKWDRDRIGLLMNALADALESEPDS